MHVNVFAGGQLVGVLPDERIETGDGLELTFATHVIGPFLLTRLLRSQLEQWQRQLAGRVETLETIATGADDELKQRLLESARPNEIGASADPPTDG